MKIKVIAFDADDTLWENEHYFKGVEDRFCELFEEFHPQEHVRESLNKVSLANVPLYGFGIKSFTLSIMETCLHLSETSCDKVLMGKVIELGKKMLTEPVDVMDGVEDTLKYLQNRYKLILATKGDLMDQERKLKKSGLLPYFHHVEIMAEKHEANYSKLITQFDIRPEEFLMVGNSLKSDILPVLNIGGNVIHIPYHTTNIHEQADADIDNPRYSTVDNIRCILQLMQERP